MLLIWVLNVGMDNAYKYLILEFNVQMYLAVERSTNHMLELNAKVNA